MHDLRFLQAFAESKGGQCLSTEYSGMKGKYLWSCRNGHRWLARASEVVSSGQWCPICEGRRHRFSIYEMQDIAASRGGECLSEVYTNTQTKLKWKCAFGHEWTAMPQSVIHGSWCPICSSGLGERLSRAVFEQLFGAQFEKAHPSWLISQDGEQLELDGYNERLQIAFEHQGSQHYSPSQYYSARMSFSKRVEYDETKRRLCTEHHVVLIEVPEVGTLLDIKDLQSYVEKSLSDAGISSYRHGHMVDYSDAYINDSSVRMFKLIQSIAKEHGGRCLDDCYKGSKQALLFECAKGHRWATPAESIMSGTWCPYCSASAKADVARTSIEELRRAAESRGGKLLSNSYQNGFEKLEWQCAKGHIWKSSWNNIRGGKWCPECARVQLDDLRHLAELRGGKLISETVVNNSTPVEWQCSKGHRWFARPNNVKNGTWCPYCAHNRRFTIDDMEHLAELKGGECLSSSYKNARTKLLWRCDKGHEWMATPASIRAGTWCPICSRKR